MAFFENLKERASGLAQSGVAKSKELAEIGKLKLNNAAEEDAIRKAYTEIGKLYYAERGMTPDAAYAALCERVHAEPVQCIGNRFSIYRQARENSKIRLEDL